MEDLSQSEQYHEEVMSISDEEMRQPLIKPIGKDVIHRICSGQVVLSLAVAMKELVENSIDAGATIIYIHLVEYGSELLEVSDNGCGVSEENFEALALKHCTSKIRQFDDLVNIGTLGFRGEALSSLCALSDLVVSTKHSADKFGTKLIYDGNGKIIDKTTIAREQGTTVTLSNLFSTLPVRRKEFMKNLKREFGKMCQMLNAYCLVSKGIKFTCTNIVNKSRNVVVATDGKHTVRDNVINVFGAKQISSLVDVEIIPPDEQILTEYGIKEVPGEELPFTFELLVSSVSHGSGRSTTDRQFYFINSRPCEPTKLMKLVNEIYRQFNSNQYPFVYMNVKTRNLLVDVNVTPDKRQIFFENEKILLATVKASLLEAFKVFPSTFKKENMEISQFLERSMQESTRSKGIKRSATDGPTKKGSLLETFKKRSRTEGDARLVEMQRPVNMEADEDVIKQADKDLDTLIKIACQLTQTESSRRKEFIVDIEDQKMVESPQQEPPVEDTDQLELSLDVPSEKTHCRLTKTVEISLDYIKKSLENKKDEECRDIKVKFRTEIKPETNKSAEEELQKQIAKEDFEKMEIIGQFNLGFIITRLKNDLFIIDQHATDEKYNFEQLQMNTVLDSQVLVSPKPLELTAGNEGLLIEHVEVFKKNGFSFNINESAPCTKKIALTAIPVSRNFVFGKDDIDEMLFMLQESNNIVCRPSRVRAMFASRACRKSVMIGKPLSLADMRKLVNHMGEIEQPWNCPHGRPTMRHLINLDLLKNDD